MGKKGKNWYKVEPGVRRTGTPRQERGFSPTHSDDEVGLYTEAEENDFDHLQGLAGYTDQGTKKETQAVCQADNKWVLKLVPGAPACNLAYLKESRENVANLNSWECFMKGAGTQLYRAYIGAAGGWITMIQWLGWLIPVIRRTRRYIVRSQGRWQVDATEGAGLQH